MRRVDGAGGTEALVLVAHGTRSPKGVALIGSLAEAVAAELADADGSPPVRTAFVDVLGPAPREVLACLTQSGTAAVVVPAFLAAGYHVYQDVPREIAAGGSDAVALTPALGPDPTLAGVLAERVRAAGWRPGDELVFAAAGSSDARARADVRRAAGMLGAKLGVRPHVANIATGAPRVPDVVAALRNSSGGRIFIASYLLSHGLFHRRLRQAGADGVAEPIGVHPSVVRLIARRYREAVATTAVAR